MSNDFDYVINVGEETLVIEPDTRSDAYIVEAYAKQLAQMQEEE